MIISDLQTFNKKLDGVSPENPDVILVSGSDPTIFEPLLSSVKKFISQKSGVFDLIVLTGEPGDELKLQEELFNIPLFSPYRLIVLRQAEEVMKPILADKSRLAFFTNEMRKCPDRTLLFIQYDGEAPAKLTKIFENHLIHFKGHDLYSNQISDVIRRSAKNLGLHLDEEALYELKEKVTPRAVAIEHALEQLRDVLPTSKHKHIGINEVKAVLFPSPGCNFFELNDAIFARHNELFCREMNRYNPTTDNFFVLFKLMLMRADEIRHAATGRAMGMNDAELITHLGLKNRPPFIKNKILRRLAREIQTYTAEKLIEIYDLLIGLQLEFRSQVPPARQPVYFEQRVRETFFS